MEQWNPASHPESLKWVLDDFDFAPPASLE